MLPERGDGLDAHIQRQHGVARAALEQLGGFGRGLLAEVQKRTDARPPGRGLIDDRAAERDKRAAGRLGGQRRDRVALHIGGFIVEGALDHIGGEGVLAVAKQLDRGHVRAKRQARVVEQRAGGAAAARLPGGRIVQRRQRGQGDRR